MAEPASRQRGDGGGQSVKELVSVAMNDLTQLVRYEVALAKLELRADIRRLGTAGAMVGIAAFVGGLMVVLLSFALVYGLITLGIWPWAAFLIVAGLCAVLAVGAIGVVALKVRRMNGLRRTKQTVQGDLAALRGSSDGASPPTTAKAG